MSGRLVASLVYCMYVVDKTKKGKRGTSQGKYY